VDTEVARPVRSLVRPVANVVSFRSRLLVLINWAWEYLFFDRPVRLIVAAEPEAPRSGRPARARRPPRK
jgi:hypothetical protein